MQVTRASECFFYDHPNVMVEVKSSPAYPGLPTEYRKLRVRTSLLLLPENGEPALQALH